jgi:acyl-CoA thioesterase
MARFDDDTTLEPAGEGRFRATLGEGWRVGRAPNGGFLAALGAGALSRVLPHPDPLTVTTHFLRRLDAGPVDCEVETIRTGRTQSSGQVTMSQGGREAVRLLAVYGDLAAAAGPTRVSAAPPDLPPPDRWPSSRDLEATRLPEVADRFDIRLDPEAVSWLGGPAENAELVGPS